MVSTLPRFGDPHREPVDGIRRPDSPTDPPPAAPKKSLTSSPGINRPPAPPGDRLGPYFQFVTTQGRLYRASVLLLHRRGHPRPELVFDHSVSQSCTVLYDDIFDMTALRFDIFLTIPDGYGDERVGWEVHWLPPAIASETTSSVDTSTRGCIHVPQWDQKWRGGFFSCNGFDMTVPVSVVEMFGFANVWKHLNSVNAIRPLHVMIWGGDQIYIDFIFDDIPFLKRWIGMDFDHKWDHEFSEEVSFYISEYFFNTYHENWERPEVKEALSSTPALMQWDDHDIFDGAGSYPSRLRKSPVMLGLFRCAQKFRLLFQHHTTPWQARSHGLFGHEAHSVLSQLGPRLCAISLDSRTERTDTQVCHPNTYKVLFEKLKKIPNSTNHLLAILPVPLSFIRVKLAEKLFEFLKNRPSWFRRLPGLKGQNSIFGLPELYDDLLDEWSHENHVCERNHLIEMFQSFAKTQQVRVTFLSGDVHCAGFAVFRSKRKIRIKEHVKPRCDPRLMYQVISSAIVNQSPPRYALIAYHYLVTKWRPFKGTEESLVEMFERRPEEGRRARHRKLMPNRNWCYFEEIIPEDHLDELCDRLDADAEACNDASKKYSLQWFQSNYLFDKRVDYPSTLGPTSDSQGMGFSGAILHKHSHGIFCHHRSPKQYFAQKAHHDHTNGTGHTYGGQGSGLRIRLWLESREKEPDGRKFASYQIIIPDLRV